MASVNEEVLHVWVLGAGNTGLAGTMSDTLVRFPTAATSEAGTETVSIAEVGSTGSYAITYTPTLAYLYTLQVDESVNFFRVNFEDNVTPAATATAASDGYCSEADVVAWAQMGGYSGSTTPTETQVLSFIAMRAAEVYGWMAQIVGTSAPGPTGYAVTIDTSTDAGTALNYQCRMANAIGAAMDALEAAGSGDRPARTERLTELAAAYASLMPVVQGLVRQYLGSADGFSATHISNGDVTVPSRTATPQQGLIMTSDTEW